MVYAQNAIQVIFFQLNWKANVFWGRQVQLIFKIIYQHALHLVQVQIFV